MLLILMIVELLYTVQVSFREHVLTADPFLIVALIAATRRILVLTAEFSEMRSLGETAFRNAMIEMGVLTVMMLVLVVSLFLLRKPHVERTIARGKSPPPWPSPQTAARLSGLSQSSCIGGVGKGGCTACPF